MLGAYILHMLMTNDQKHHLDVLKHFCKEVDLFKWTQEAHTFPLNQSQMCTYKYMHRHYVYANATHIYSPR